MWFYTVNVVNAYAEYVVFLYKFWVLFCLGYFSSKIFFNFFYMIILDTRIFKYMKSMHYQFCQYIFNHLSLIIDCKHRFYHTPDSFMFIYMYMDLFMR